MILYKTLPQCVDNIFKPNRQRVYTPKGGRCLLCHSMNYACTGSPWVVIPRTGQDFGRRPRQPADNPKEVWRKRGLQFLHPRPTQTPEGHACCQGPSLVTQDTPIGSQGPFQAGGQAPPIHRVTKPRQGEFNGIPGLLGAKMKSAKQ